MIPSVYKRPWRPIPDCDQSDKEFQGYVSLGFFAEDAYEEFLIFYSTVMQ